MPTSKAVQRRKIRIRKENETLFGYVVGNWKELSEEQQQRYKSVYCGICREIRERSSQLARLGLSYDMAFLALLLMSLYEPREETGKRPAASIRSIPEPGRTTAASATVRI